MSRSGFQGCQAAFRDGVKRGKLFHGNWIVKCHVRQSQFPCESFQFLAGRTITEEQEMNRLVLNKAFCSLQHGIKPVRITQSPGPQNNSLSSESKLLFEFEIRWPWLVMKR